MFLDHTHPLVGHVRRQCERRDRRLALVAAEVQLRPHASAREIAALVKLPERTVRRLMAQIKQRRQTWRAA